MSSFLQFGSIKYAVNRLDYIDFQGIKGVMFTMARRVPSSAEQQLYKHSQQQQDLIQPSASNSKPNSNGLQG
jgi:hypothetical protein